MPSFNFETGQKTFDINGDPNRTITFAPSDTLFIRRLFDGLAKLDESQNRHREQLANMKEPEQLLELVEAADKENREIIDGIFGPGSSVTVFGNLSTCGVAGGLPLWAGFLVAVVGECDSYLGEQEKAANPRLEQLLKKYKK